MIFALGLEALEGLAMDVSFPSLLYLSSNSNCFFGVGDSSFPPKSSAIRLLFEVDAALVVLGRGRVSSRVERISSSLPKISFLVMMEVTGGAVGVFLGSTAAFGVGNEGGLLVFSDCATWSFDVSIGGLGAALFTLFGLSSSEKSRPFWGRQVQCLESR